MAVRYYEQDIRSGLTDRRRLSAFLQSLIRGYQPWLRVVDLVYIFCNDEYLLSINKEFLNHDTLTDIITFDMSESRESMAGEIYISVERVRENAAGLGISYKNELHRVIFHGALHLCGLKDKKPADKEKMRAAEDECLSSYFQT